MKKHFELTYDSSNQTQNDRRHDKDPVPVVVSIHCGHTEEDED